MISLHAIDGICHMLLQALGMQVKCNHRITPCTAPPDTNSSVLRRASDMRMQANHATM